MKGAAIPAVAIMPSPLFLWRFKVILFLLWGLCCCKISWDSVMRMSADLRDLFLYEAFLYYNPLLLVAITFPDFFLADIFTSMSKVFSDLERSVCRMVNRQVATIAWFEADSICGSHSIAIPLALVFPYLCRFFQCLRQYKDTKEKTCLLNALEILRRWQWVFFRVENEWNKMTSKQNLEMSSDMPSEGDRLLDSSNHTV
nr:unnamed protein product [Digitaria exilis]